MSHGRFSLQTALATATMVAMPDATTPPTGDYEPSCGPPPRLPREKAGDRIGPYKLLQKLGEGGMGAVWHAEQTAPVRRQVALKLIRPDLAADHFLARFEAERQALALMDHPNIAKVFDAGTTESGAPYLVMELVKGIPFTKYCDDAKLTIRERVQLFVPVCRAVQHAHTKGIIHRDLKPTNILVALYDGVPVPKIIDFGIAKATHQPLTERTLVTQFGSVVGTPEYMAPEQAEFNALDIDTRADVYSLGVILYELLAGSPPFDRKQFESFALLEILRLVKESEPPSPSKKLSSVHTLPEIAAKRRVEPQKLGKLIRGELDWVVMKALEKERGRRYGTADLLAADLEHYLADEPVAAGPPSAGYRIWKAFQRHKGRFVAAGLSSVLLVSSLIAVSTFAVQTARVKNELQAALTDKDAALEKEAAERRRADDLAKVSDIRRQEAETRSRELAREIAFSRYTLAQMALEQNRGRAVNDYLDDIPPEHRNIEWGLLQAKLLGGSRIQLTDRLGEWTLRFDNRELAAIVDNGVRAWDTVTGEERAIKIGLRPGDSGTIAYGPHGVRVAAPMTDGSVRVYDEGKAAFVSIKPFLVGNARTVRLSPDGARLAVGFGNGQVIIVRLTDNKVMARLASESSNQSKEQYERFAWSANGKYFTRHGLQGEKAITEIFDVENNKVLVRTREDVEDAVCSPGGQIFARKQKDSPPEFIDVSSGRRIIGLGDETDAALGTFSPDGQLFFTSSGKSGAVNIWSVPSGRKVKSIRTYELILGPLQFSPDGRFLGGPQRGRAFCLWSSTSSDEPVECQCVSRNPVFCLSDDGRFLCHAAADNDVHVRQIVTSQVLTRLHGPSDTVFSIGMSENGHRIVASSSDKSVYVWDLGTGSRLHTLKHENDVGQVVVDKWGRRALVSSKNAVHLWSLDSGMEVARLPVSAPWARAAFFPDGERIATGARDGTIHVWHASGKEVARLIGHTQDITALRMIHGGRTLVSASYDRTVRLWDVAKGRETLQLRGPTNIVTSLLITRDEQRVIAAAGDHTVRIWDATTGRELLSCSTGSARADVLGIDASGYLLLEYPLGDIFAPVKSAEVRAWPTSPWSTAKSLRGHSNLVGTVAFLRDGRLLSASGDKTVRLWDVDKEREIAVFRGHDQRVVGMTVSPDETCIATASADKTLRIWEIATANELRKIPLTEEGVPNELAISEDGNVIRGESTFWGKTYYWNAATGEVLPKSPDGVIFDQKSRVRHGNRIAISDMNTVRVVDARIDDRELARRRNLFGPDAVWHASQFRLAAEAGDTFAVTFHYGCLRRLSPFDLVPNPPLGLPIRLY